MITAFYNNNNRNNKLLCLFIVYKEHNVHLKYNQKEKSAIVKNSLQSYHTFSRIKLLHEVQNSN